MKRLIFAFFDNPASAQAALEAIEASPTAKREVHRIDLHLDSVPNSDLRSGETGGRRGAFIGALLGGLSGAILGALLAVFGLLGVSLFYGAMMVGVGGFFFGGIGGAIVGQSEPDPRIMPMAEHLQPGEALITVETYGASEALEIDDILIAHGASVREKVRLDQHTEPRPSQGPVMRVQRDA